MRTLTIAVPGTLAVLMPVTSQPAQAQSKAVAQEMAQAPMPLSFPGVVSNQNGTLEVFATALNGDVWHAYQVPGSAMGWSGWNGWLTVFCCVNQPNLTVGVNGDGRLELFGTYEAEIRHAWQITPGGRLEVFATGSDGQIYHSYQSGAYAGGWSPWEPVP